MRADEFTNRKPGQMLAAGQTSAAGRLVEHGNASYENKPGNCDSYFVTLENDKGELHKTWGVDLKRAMSEAKPEIGAKIGLEHAGSETVRLLDGQTVERNSLKVHSGEELAFKQLEERVSRSGVKETTLDYTREFANRRGIAEQVGIRNEITLSNADDLRQNPRVLPGPEQGRPLAVHANEERARQTAGSVREDDQCQGPHRSAFDGLKLGRGAAARVTPARDKADKPRERPRTAERPKRGMFDGLKLNADRGAVQDRGDAPRPQRGERDESLRPMSGFEQSNDRFARALIAVERNNRQGLPVLEGQKSELRQANIDSVGFVQASLAKLVLRTEPQTVWGRPHSEVGWSDQSRIKSGGRALDF